MRPSERLVADYSARMGGEDASLKARASAAVDAFMMRPHTDAPANEDAKKGTGFLAWTRSPFTRIMALMVFGPAPFLVFAGAGLIAKVALIPVKFVASRAFDWAFKDSEKYGRHSKLPESLRSAARSVEEHEAGRETAAAIEEYASRRYSVDGVTTREAVARSTDSRAAPTLASHEAAAQIEAWRTTAARALNRSMAVERAADPFNPLREGDAGIARRADAALTDDDCSARLTTQSGSLVADVRKGPHGFEVTDLTSPDLPSRSFPATGEGLAEHLSALSGGSPLIDRRAKLAYEVAKGRGELVHIQLREAQGDPVAARSLAASQDPVVRFLAAETGAMTFDRACIDPSPSVVYAGLSHRASELAHLNDIELAHSARVSSLLDRANPEALESDAVSAMRDHLVSEVQSRSPETRVIEADDPARAAALQSLDDIGR